MPLGQTQNEDLARAGGFLISEANNTLSRTEGVLISGQDLKAGMPLGIITASGKYTAHNVGATTGEQVVAGILYDDVDASAGDEPCTVIDRLAEVQTADLLGEGGGAWPGTYSAGEQTTVIAELLTLLIKVR
jgi:hypothetical protein